MKPSVEDLVITKIQSQLDEVQHALEVLARANTAVLEYISVYEHAKMYEARMKYEIIQAELQNREGGTSEE